MATLKDWFGSANPPITDDYNPPALSMDTLGFPQPHPNGQPVAVGAPPPQKLYDLGSYWTPFQALWNRPKNVLQG